MKIRIAPVSMLLALGLGACGGAIEPDSRFQLNFNVALADTIMEGDTVIFTREDYDRLNDLRPITAAGETGRIRVFGSFVSSCLAPPVANSERTRDEVTLTISFPSPGLQGCASAPGPYTYEARFTRVPAGSYRLVVRHKGDQLRADGLVLEQQAEVP